MSQGHWSLRRRLLAWLLVPLGVVAAATLIEAYGNARAAADTAYDRLLGASALAIAERVVLSNNELEVDLPYVALEMLSSSAQDRVFYRVTGPGGAFVTGYRDLPSIPASIPIRHGATGFHDAVYRGEPVRVAVHTQLYSGPNEQGLFTVEVARTRGERDRLARAIALATARRILVLIGVAALVTWIGIGRGLAPLKRLEAAIRARAPGDLRPVETPVPSEVEALVSAINHLVGRLGESLQAMQRFISDASHQLQTPLAALRTEAELTLRERNPAAARAGLERVRDATVRSSRLAAQLLSHARIEQLGDPGDADQPVDAGQLAAEIGRELAPTALARDIDLGFESEGAPLTTRGDALMLREMLKNLLDNALRHGPPGSPVQVRVLRQRATIVVEIEDQGPGIAVAERDRVFERFYRILGTEAEGAGLGLPIAREVAWRHGGGIELLDGRAGHGLLVRVYLPGASI